MILGVPELVGNVHVILQGILEGLFFLLRPRYLLRHLTNESLELEDHPFLGVYSSPKT